MKSREKPVQLICLKEEELDRHRQVYPLHIIRVHIYFDAYLYNPNAPGTSTTETNLDSKKRKTKSKTSIRPKQANAKPYLCWPAASPAQPILYQLQGTCTYVVGQDLKQTYPLPSCLLA